jgi:transposase InsO family protein
MVVMDQFIRRTVGFAVYAGDVDGRALCRTFNQIIARQALLRYLSSDNSPLFEFGRWQANLRVVDVKEIKTVPYVPLSHPFVERLIGTVRREYLDHALFWNGHDLQRKLTQFQTYYNELRVHSSLDGRPPAELSELVPGPKVSRHEYRWQSVCRRMYELPIAA